jgi:cytochrome c
MRVVVALTAAIIPFAAVGAACADGDPARGEQLYADCIACHPVERDVHGIGPSLAGIIGRKAGEVAGYRYSGPLKRSGLTWTPEALDTFIADPQASVPANRMPGARQPHALRWHDERRRSCGPDCLSAEDFEVISTINQRPATRGGVGAGGGRSSAGVDCQRTPLRPR